jgi:hypothetical protein
LFAIAQISSLILTIKPKISLKKAVQKLFEQPPLLAVAVRRKKLFT